METRVGPNGAKARNEPSVPSDPSFRLPNMCSLTACSAPPAEETAPSFQPRPLDEIEDEICTLAGHIAAAMCRWLLLIAEFDAREGWATWGTVSCAHWLSWRCSIGPGAAREHVRVARRLTELPLIRAAFAAGRLSYCKARALTRVATEDSEAPLLEIAEHATGAQLEKLARSLSAASRASAESAMELHERRGLHLSWEGEMLRVEGALAPEEGVALMRALDAAERELPNASSARATRSQRRADALAVLARGGRGASEIVVHVDEQSLASDAVVERSELEEGPPIAPETARRLSCDAAVVRIVERDGEPLSVGRRTRTIPPALRRALRSRDAGCRFPGCTHRRHLHAHHIRHWARGGATSLENLVHLCSHHHRLVHEGGFEVSWDRCGRLAFRTPHGYPIAAAPAAVGGNGTWVEAASRGDRIEIGPDTCRPLSAGDRLDYDLAVWALLNRPSVTDGLRIAQPSWPG